MKQIETIQTGKNFSAVSVGKVNEIIEHELPMGPNVTIQGKVFVGQAVGATGSELSFQTLVPGQDSGFLHTHKTHEELYIILVECDGSITYIEVSNVTEEDKTKIVRLLETMPRWVPGKKDGQPIRSRYRTTIRF